MCDKCPQERTSPSIAVQRFVQCRKKQRALSSTVIPSLKNAMVEYNLSARAYDRILKVARTIADLAAADKVNSDHVSEAIQLRSLDRQLWG